MSNSAVEMTNLLYRYAERMDGGDLEGAAALLQHARIKVTNGDNFLDAAGILLIWKQYIKIYPCGTPRTKHVISNPIIEIDETAGKATIRSNYTVFQATHGLALQPIAVGRYHDEFERVGQAWRFCFRDYSLLELTGDLSFHLNDFESRRLDGLS
ncbi:MAG: nuclear transport factor 2 family protein [Formivibrio sp.]|nr:nuclear transport factor 2 family protein [Formivibrio sp.]